MTAPGRYAASDGSFAKSAGSAAARGGVLIAIAVVIGFVLLAWGFDGGDSDAAGGASTVDDGNDDDGSGAGGDTDTTTTVGDGDDDPDTTTTEGDGDNGENGDTDTTTTVAAEVDDPSTIKVAVLNGTDTGGLAGERAGILGALNYVTTAGNAAGRPDIVDSKVYFVTGFADEAGVVAAALSGPASVLELAPDDPATLEDGDLADAGSADIIVVLGTDDALK